MFLVSGLGQGISSFSRFPLLLPACAKNPSDISLARSLLSSRANALQHVRNSHWRMRVTVPRSLTSRREMADDRGSLELFPFLSRAPRFFEWPSRADQHDAKSSVRAFPHRQTVLHCPRRYVPPSSLPLPHPLLISSYSSFSSTRIIRYLFIWERFNLI